MMQSLQPPFVRRETDARMSGLDWLIALLPPLAFSVFHYGLRPLFLLFCGILAAVLTQLLFVRLFHGANQWIRPAVMGGGLAMICPLSAPWWLPMVGAAVAVIGVNLLRLAGYHNLFHPAVLGWLFLLLVFPGRAAVFPSLQACQTLEPFSTTLYFDTADSLLQQLSGGVLPNNSLEDLLLGYVPGGLGGVAVLGLGISLVYLILRRAVAFEVTLSLLISELGFSLLLWNLNIPAYHMILLQLSGGSLLFAAMFFAADYTAPKTPLLRVVYGLLAGFCIALLRRWGLGEFAVPFVLLVCALFSNLMERVVSKWLLRPSPAKR